MGSRKRVPDKRIRQAEVRASQKRRRAQLAKKSSSLRPQNPSTPPVPSLPYVVSGYGTPVSPSYPAVSLPGSNFSNPFGAVNWPRLTVVRMLAVALLVAVSAISGISAPSFRRSFQLANLGNVLDGLGCWCTRRGHR